MRSGNALPSLVLSLLSTLLLLSCSNGSSPTGSDDDDTVAVRPKGDRILAIDLNEGEGQTYQQIVDLVRPLGVRSANLSLGWRDLETAPGVYEPTVDLLAIAESYYPNVDFSILLMIGPIDTNVDQMPDDLKGKAFDDPEVIARFRGLIDWVFTKIPTLELEAIAIGNEIDIYLGSDIAAWESYARFSDSIAAYIRTKRSDLPIGVKITQHGLVGPFADQAARVNRASDVILTTHYPLDDAFRVDDTATLDDDFAAVVELYPDRPIRFAELGFPSDELNGSSEAKQADFIRAAFRAWDRYAENIEAISFSILTDRAPEEIDRFRQYYGLDDPAFLAFLRTLGLRNRDGSPKEAWNVLVEEGGKRGWGSFD